MAGEARGCLGLLAAAIGAAVAGGVWMGPAFGFLPAFIAALVVAAVHVGLLAMPVYFCLERRYRPNLPIVIVASALIGALPISLLALASAGTKSLGGTFAFGLLCGVAGGVAFWLVVRPPAHRGRGGGP